MTDDLRHRLRRVDPAPTDGEPPTGSRDAIAVLREIESRTAMKPRQISTEELETRVGTRGTEEIEGTSTVPGEPRRRTTRRAPAIAAAAFAVVLLVGAALFGMNVLFGGDETVTEPGVVVDASPVAVASAYWEALEAGDVDAALATVHPNLRDGDFVSPPGRGDSIVSSLAWYEVVGWEWTFGSCRADTDVVAICFATARNAWSDALGVEPVTGEFRLRLIDGVIISVELWTDSFVSQWGPQVFEVFVRWVEANHPEEAAIMFSENPIDDEILELYRVNTERFVAAQTADG